MKKISILVFVQFIFELTLSINAIGQETIQSHPRFIDFPNDTFSDLSFTNVLFVYASPLPSEIRFKLIRECEIAIRAEATEDGRARIILLDYTRAGGMAVPTPLKDKEWIRKLSRTLIVYDPIEGTAVKPTRVKYGKFKLPSDELPTECAIIYLPKDIFSYSSMITVKYKGKGTKDKISATTTIMRNYLLIPWD